LWFVGSGGAGAGGRVVLGWGSKAEADLIGGCTAAPRHNTRALSPPQHLVKRRTKIWERLISWLIKSINPWGRCAANAEELALRQPPGGTSQPSSSFLASPLPELLPHLVHSSCRS